MQNAEIFFLLGFRVMFKFLIFLNHKERVFLASRIKICLNYDFDDYNDFYDLDFHNNYFLLL